MSWQQYGEILRQNAEDALRFATEPPIACPNDGTPLDIMPNGVRHCPAGDWMSDWSDLPSV